jgi:hypothetical protein
LILRLLVIFRTFFSFGFIFNYLSPLDTSDSLSTTSLEVLSEAMLSLFLALPLARSFCLRTPFSFGLQAASVLFPVASSAKDRLALPSELAELLVVELESPCLH